MRTLRDFLSDSDALLARAAGLLVERLGVDRGAPAVGVYVPGRVEFLGKHTDYAGGRSLLLAVDRGFRLVAATRDDRTLRVATGADEPDVRQFDYGQTPAHAGGHWVNYVATVARRVAQNFSDATDLRGLDAAFLSDLPVAAGMSSSSALMVATFLGLCTANDLQRTAPYARRIESPIELAEYLGCVENGQSFATLTGEAGVGTFGGSEDHTAMLCCKPELLSQFSFAPSVFERDIAFPATMDLLIASSGVQAVKTGEAMAQYNRASLRACKAAEAYNRAAGTDCRHLREVALRVGAAGLMDAMAAIRRGAAPADADLDLPGRFEQFFREDQEIIPAVGDALAAGDVGAIGGLVDASHAGADRGLQNQIPQTNFLQAAARDLGALAATCFGAGFGGSVWAMIDKPRSAQLAAAWARAYAEKFPDDAAAAEFFLTRPGRPASVIAE